MYNSFVQVTVGFSISRKYLSKRTTGKSIISMKKCVDTLKEKILLYLFGLLELIIRLNE